MQKAAPLAKEFGNRALIISGQSIQRIAPLLEQLQVFRITYVIVNIGREPTTERIDAALEKARQADVDLVISMGGGSAIDAGKAVAALLTNPGEALDYLEVIGKGRPLTKDPLPHIAIPTTAGTGAEVTKNAVLRSIEHNVKVSLRHDLMIPNAALIDPELTWSMPPAITASTGMDALTQLIEPFLCNRPNPLTDALCREGISRVARSLRSAYSNGEDNSAREDMAVASLFGGLALANAKLGAVHGFAGPIGGMFDAPHGAICAQLLPKVMAQNLRALQERDSNSATLPRFTEIAQLLTGKSSARASDALEWLTKLCHDLCIPKLSDFGMQEKDIVKVVEKSRSSSSMKGNPVKLTERELCDIIKDAL